MYEFIFSYYGAAPNFETERCPAKHGNTKKLSSLEYYTNIKIDYGLHNYLHKNKIEKNLTRRPS